MKDSVIIWFRQDLRIDDNPALFHAVKTGLNVIPLYIWSPETEGHWAMGSASKVWLHYSLIQLDQDLEKSGSGLVVLRGNPLDILLHLISHHQVKAVFWNRRYEPSIIKRDSVIKKQLRQCDIAVNSFNASLLYEPHSISNKQGQPYKVYTAFWNATQALPEPDPPLPNIRKIVSEKTLPNSLAVEQLELLPSIQWYDGIKDHWTPGTKHAKQYLKTFLNTMIGDYQQKRDFPAERGISSLSPYLHFGEISPHRVWSSVKQASQGRAISQSATVYLKQLIWREFAHHLLFHFPNTDRKPLREEFNRFPWKKSKSLLRAWQSAETGYPIVDAGMRELWTTGWMHNRVRMIVASFLIKDCLIHWLEGSKWFWDTLTDADLANNSMGWQWVAGSGADAAPYFRIFNPVTQGERFDPDGEYIRKWLPELTDCPDQFIHKPWQATSMDLQLANIKLGQTYPQPVLDHAQARKTALDALKQMKDSE